MNKQLIINLASQVWDEVPTITVENNSILVHNFITETPMYEIFLEGEIVVYVEMKDGFNCLGAHDLWFIKLIDENASEIEVA